MTTKTKIIIGVSAAVVVGGGFLIYETNKKKAAAAPTSAATENYPAGNDPTNADSVPLYNSNILEFWNWFNTVWSCDDWVTWHKAMKAKYGKAQADQTFLHYWNDLATGSSAIDCRSFNEAFRNYMTSENLLDALYSGLGVIAEPLGVGTDVVTSVGTAVTNAGKTAANITNVLKVAIPIALVVAIGFGGFWAYKHFIQKK